MPREIHLVTHASGPWLLRVGGRCYAVAPELGHRLIPPGSEVAGSAPTSHLIRLQGEAGEGRISAGPSHPALSREEAAALGSLLRSGGAPTRFGSGGRRIWPRLPLLPAAAVDAIARRLRPLVSFPCLLGQVCVGLVTYGLGFMLTPAAGPPATGPPGPGASLVGLAALGLFLITGIWHELGHAAALRREGYPAGGIGLGLLLIIPVLYCDVTAVAALPRSGRLRVDVAGIACQLCVGGLLLLLGMVSGALAPRLAGLGALMAVCWSLLPFVRVDGYWLLCDALGRRDLEAPLTTGEAVSSPARRRALGVFLVVYRTCQGLFMLAICFWLPWLLWRRLPLSGWIANENIWPRVLSALAMLGLAIGLIWICVSMIKRLGALARANGNDLRSLWRGSL